MKISAKLTLFLVGDVLIFTGLAVSLIRQTHEATVAYDALLAQPVREADHARVMQVDFKKQVQEWKDILLRGHTSADLEKYTKNFRTMESATQSEGRALLAELADPQAKVLVSQFLAAHATLSTHYDAAYQTYVSSGFDFKAADKIVRGQDRPPTDLCDKVVERLGNFVEESVAAQQSKVALAHKTALGIAGVLLLILGGVGLLIVRSIVGRLGRLKAVSDRLAKADIDGLAIDIGGRDEIGEFGESMKGVLAAVEELTALSDATQSKAIG